MFDNKYPYTDFHELNLDWFLAEFKKVTDKVTSLDATVQQFTEFVTNYFDNLDVQEQVNIKLNEMAADGTLSALIQPLFENYEADINAIVENQNAIISDQNSIISNQNSKITVLEGRVDNLATIDPGSITTTADAELVDIRTGFDGVVLASAGDSVRRQVELLHAPLTNKTFSYEKQGYYNSSTGGYNANVTYLATDYIPCEPDDIIYLSNIKVQSTAAAIAYYDKKLTFISSLNNQEGDVLINNIPSNAAYFACSTEASYGTPEGYLYKNYDAVSEKLKSIHNPILPIDTDFFEGVNYFNPDDAVVYTDRYMNTSGNVLSNALTSMVFPVDPDTDYYLHIPNGNRGIIGENTDSLFFIGSTYTCLYNTGYNNVIHFTTGSTAKYCFIYFYNGVNYDWAENKDGIILNKNAYYGNVTPHIKNEYISDDINNAFTNKNILIFGDSVTDCCNFTINSGNETTAYSFKNPSNSYVDGGGNIIKYSMWPKIMKENLPVNEVRNYALAGASYKTETRTPGNERQNVQYQIDVAINDRYNPNGAFTVNDFYPDIIIFALGTNDGTPADTFDSAMAATVYESDGVTINVNATIAALNDSKTIASARKSFMRMKQEYPMAQIYVSLPIQRANNDTNFGSLRTELIKIAQRYGCIIIDATADSGITRDFNTWNGLGEYLKDGLHPNEKGQNLLARCIIQKLKSCYSPFGTGYNN